MNRCLTCDKETDNNKFCSISCQMSHRGHEMFLRRVEKYHEHPSYCAECCKVLDYYRRRGKFCSRQCTAKFRYKDFPKKNTCKVCGEISKTKKGICRKCFDQRLFSLFVNNELNSSGAQTKRILFFVGDNKCFQCGWNTQNEFTKRVPLELHHKDGDKRNNFYSNVDLICPNCHSLTLNFRHNGKGRKYAG